MPFGPGTYGDMGGGGLAGPALQRQGIPQPGVDAAGPPAPLGSSDALSEAMQMLKGGQVGAEKFLAILALLAGQILPGMDQGGPQQAPQGPAPDGASIQSLLG